MIYFLLCYIVTTFLFILYEILGRKRRICQTERELGVSTHKVKNGTLTAGGIVFVLSAVIFSVLFINPSLKLLFILLPFFSYFMLGAIDDFLIAKQKRNDGLSPKIKVIIEIIISIITYCIYRISNKNEIIDLYFFKVELKFIYLFFIVFMYVASANSFNLTDGLDGLLVSLCIIMLLGMYVIALKKNERDIMKFIIILLASITPFYFLNYPKASIFMGDSGSLALGAVMTSIAIILDELFIYIIMAIPLIFESFSVILQVSYFKITKGKRIFKMAPFHHHLELKGYSEKLIRIIFSFVEVVLVLLALYIKGYI